MKVLVIGGGGREHALAWKLAQSPRVGTVFVAPGNPGTASEAGVENIPITDLADLADFAVAESVALTVVGPEAALAAGAVDIFRSKGLRIFGPTRGAAQLESSKAFAKAFMHRHAIPTAAHVVFTDARAAHAHVDAQQLPAVVKADGLAAGKGVVVALTRDEAHAAIDAMLGSASGEANTGADPDTDNGTYTDNDTGAGTSGRRVVIEAFLAGEEASFIVVCDGRSALPLATSQDHKRLGDGDTGPNTGGMGAYSPAPVVTPAVHDRVMREIVAPTLAGMAAEGMPFTGFLYVGLMIDDAGAAKVVEYNARLGDPETQPILMRLQTDLFELLWQATEPAAERSIAGFDLRWDARPALGVVMAASGYPSEPRRGDPIVGLSAAAGLADVKVFQAGTAPSGGSIVTAGGRVLCVTALGATTLAAQQQAYDAVAGIAFDGMQYRHDIGRRATSV